MHQGRRRRTARDPPWILLDQDRPVVMHHRDGGHVGRLRGHAARHARGTGAAVHHAIHHGRPLTHAHLPHRSRRGPRRTVPWEAPRRTRRRACTAARGCGRGTGAHRRRWRCGGTRRPPARGVRGFRLEGQRRCAGVQRRRPPAQRASPRRPPPEALPRRSGSAGRGWATGPRACTRRPADPTRPSVPSGPWRAGPWATADPGRPAHGPRTGRIDRWHPVPAGPRSGTCGTPLVPHLHPWAANAVHHPGRQRSGPLAIRDGGPCTGHGPPSARREEACGEDAARDGRLCKGNDGVEDDGDRRILLIHHRHHQMIVWFFLA